MGFRLRRRGAVLSGLIGMMFLFLPACARAAGSEADRMAKALWDKLLTHCGESYFYAGSPFDGSGDLNGLLPMKLKVMEFQKVHFNIVPMKLTPAEQMNGVTFRGRITMLASVYREQGGPWRDGIDANPRNTDEVFGQAVKSIGANAGQMGITGVMAFEMASGAGNAWAIRRSQATSSMAMVLDKSFQDLTKFLAWNGMRKYDCNTGTGSTMPGGAAQPIAPGLPNAQARLVQAALSSTRASPFIQDARKGIAFLALTPQELAAFTFLHDGTRFASPQAAPYKQVTQAAGDRFPTGGTLPDSQYLRPGTTYRLIYFDDRDPRHTLAQPQFVRTRDLRFYALVAVTSGPHTGETVLIDARAMNSAQPVVQASAAR